MSSENYVSTARHVLQNEARSILRASERLDANFIEAIEILFSKSKKIIVTGIGKSGHLGKKISATLSSTGSPSCFLHPIEALHGDLGIHQHGDPVIFLSNSGSTPELIALEPILRKRGAQIVGILGNTRSKLSLKVDVTVDASVDVEADPLGIVPTSSFAVAGALGDAIASSLMEKRGFSETDYASTHPAGQLGRNLILNVSDVMHKPAEIACVNINTVVKEIVVKMSTYPLGAAFVFDQNEQLTGIITDGDLRRALMNHDEINDIKADKIMTPTPITVSPNITLGEALKKMENRDSQISVLPVIDEEHNEVVCLLRLHDIYDGNQ